MRRLLYIARIASALAGAFAFSVLGALTLTWGPRLCRHVDGALTRAENVEAKLYGTAANLDAASEVWAGAAQAQAQSMAQLVGSARQVLTAAAGTAGAATDTLTTVRAQAKAIGPLIGDSDTLLKNLSQDAAQFNEDEVSLNKAIADADGQLSDAGPKAQAILSATQALMQENARTAADIRTIADKLANPKASKWQRIRTALDLLWRGAMLAK